MNVEQTSIPGVLLIEPSVYKDERGFFLEVWNKKIYESIGIEKPFVQDNFSNSMHGTLRGLHFQREHPQGKLVSVSLGEVFDVVVDIRPGSSTFGKWYGVTLSGENKRQIWIPPGLAHGFCVLSEMAHFSYKCTEFYYPGDEYSLLWCDEQVGVNWPIEPKIISDKDAKAKRLAEHLNDNSIINK